MNFFDSIVLGIVEGVTEFLPVSSTGHLILTSKLLKIPTTEFLKTFEVVIQLGAIFAVVFLYRKTLLCDRQILKKIFAAFVPTAILGFVFHKAIKTMLGSSSVVLWSMLLGGIFIILFELVYREKNNDTAELNSITYKQAVLIGLFQSLAMVPGVSRSAATIIGGLTLGLKRKNIVEFSFLLAVPTMLAASALELTQANAGFSSLEFTYLGVGFVVAFLFALLAVKSFLAFIRTNNFIGFGIYRIAAAAFLWKI